MNQKRARNIRKVAKIITKKFKTEYVKGKPPTFNMGERFLMQGVWYEPGDRIDPGIPTILKVGCFKSVYKKLKVEIEMFNCRVAASSDDRRKVDENGCNSVNDISINGLNSELPV